MPTTTQRTTGGRTTLFDPGGTQTTRTGGTRTTNSTSGGRQVVNTSGGRTTQSGTVMPVEPEGYRSLGDLLRRRAQERLMSSVDLSGYETQGLSNINQVFRNIGESQNADLTSRGLATSPVAGVARTNTQNARGGEMAAFLNSLPLLQRQMQAEDFGLANQFYAQRPLGQTSTGTTTTDPTETISTTDPTQTVQTTDPTETVTTQAPRTTIQTSDPTTTTVDSDGDGIADVLGELLGSGQLIPMGRDIVQTGRDIGRMLGIGGGAAPLLAGAGGAGLAAGAGTPAALAAAAPLLNTAAPATFAGVSTTTAALPGAAAPGAGAGSSAITGLLTNPITIAVAAGIIGVTSWLKSQAHWEANEFVQRFENPFARQITDVHRKFFDAARTGQLAPQDAQVIRAEVEKAWQEWLGKSQTWGQGGSDKRLVSGQGIRNLTPWMNQILKDMDTVIGQLGGASAV